MHCCAGAVRYNWYQHMQWALSFQEEAEEDATGASKGCVELTFQKFQANAHSSLDEPQG